MGNWPDFDATGCLPAGIYPVTISELLKSPLVAGRSHASQLWRTALLHNLAHLVRQLWQTGIADTFLAGSFTADTDYPNDIDGFFLCSTATWATGAMERQLNQLNGEKIWNWDEADLVLDPRSGKLQLPMWHRYRVELYPHPVEFGDWNDDTSPLVEFAGLPRAFSRLRSTGEPRGIVRLQPPFDAQSRLQTFTPMSTRSNAFR